MNKKSFTRAKILFFSVLLVLFVLLEFEVMINYYENYTYFVFLGGLIILDFFFLMTTLTKKSYQGQQESNEHLETIETTEKAAYLLLKKNFQDMDERLGELETRLHPLPGMMERNEYRVAQVLTRSMEEQKKVSKLILSRSKENTEALMNSNDELSKKIEQMVSGFEEKFHQLESLEGKIHQIEVLEENLQQFHSDMEEKLLQLETQITRELEELGTQPPESRSDTLDPVLKQLQTRQTEMDSSLKQLELSIKNEILEAVDKISSIQPRVVVTSPSIEDAPTAELLDNTEANTEVLDEFEVTAKEPEQSEHEAKDLSSESIPKPEERENVLSTEELSEGIEEPQDNQKALMEESDLDELLKGIMPKEDAVGEPKLEVSTMEDSQMDVLQEAPAESDTEEETLREVDNLLADLLPETDIIPEEEFTEDELLPDFQEKVEDTEIEPLPEEDELLSVLTEPDELSIEEVPTEVLPEPKEEKPPMPDITNPNKVMSPEEIAALIANAGGNSDPDPVTIPEPQAAPEPIKPAEEKPSMPDMTNPNKVMSPEEIAALIANI